MNTEDIRQSIRWLKSELKFPLFILDHIKQGDFVLKGPHDGILVDNVGLAINLCDHPGGLSLSTFRRIFLANELNEASVRTYYELHGEKNAGRNIVPLSKFLTERTGTCTEIAVAAKLVAQHKGKESYFVSGLYQEEYSTPHAFVILLSGERLCLFDPALNIAGPIASIDIKDGYASILLDGQSEPRYFFN